MKKVLSVIIGLSIATTSIAQKDNVGIGTTKPDQSAILDVSSSNKGLLMPRMTLSQRNSIQNPAKGLIVYQEDLLSGFYYFDGSEWKGLTGMDKSVAGVDGDWTLLGNAASATDFIGTTNVQPLRFKTANVWSGVISPVNTNAATMFGYFAGPNISATGMLNTGVGYDVMGSQAASAVTGSNNTVVGAESLTKITSGVGNIAIGSRALRSLTSGSTNFGLGGYALGALTTGNDNVGIGYGALNTSNGSSNIGIGAYALTTTAAGSANIGIGASTGENKEGNGNIYLGHNAGRAAASTSESNKLYIANTATTTPLIYGDLSADFLALGGVDATLAKRDNLATQYGLLVRKGILTEKIKVATMTSTDWSDYVFEDNYKRMTLEQVEAFIKENRHLPNVPTTEEMIANGNDLLKTDAKLLEKIEELTLYVIEMNKEIKALKKENEKLKMKK